MEKDKDKIIYSTKTEIKELFQKYVYLKLILIKKIAMINRPVLLYLIYHMVSNLN